MACPTASKILFVPEFFKSAWSNTVTDAGVSKSFVSNRCAVTTTGFNTVTGSADVIACALNTLTVEPSNPAKIAKRNAFPFIIIAS